MGKSERTSTNAPTKVSPSTRGGRLLRPSTREPIVDLSGAGPEMTPVTRSSLRRCKVVTADRGGDGDLVTRREYKYCQAQSQMTTAVIFDPAEVVLAPSEKRRLPVSCSC